MSSSTAILLLISVAAGVLIPGLMFWASRLPRMDDASVERPEPLLGWPPTHEDRARIKRISGLLVVMSIVFVLLLAAAYLAWQQGR